MQEDFDAVAVAESLSKKEFKQRELALRSDLVQLQQELREKKIPVMVVFAGVDGAGKHEMVNCLHTWMDPRWLVTHAYQKPDAHEQQRPPFWRYWRDTPFQGQVALYLSAWYSDPLVERARRQISQNTFEQKLRGIDSFERTLQDNGVLLLKVWMHLGKKAQRKRLEHLGENPETEWLIKPGAWENRGHYDRFMESSRTIVESAARRGRPWLIINGEEEHGRAIAVGEAIRDAIEERVKSSPKSKAISEKKWESRMEMRRGILARMRLNKQGPEKEAYKQELKHLQWRLYQLQHFAQVANLSTVLVFEGQDAAGKGGAIRRLVQGLDAQQYQVIPIAAPTDEEISHHYLWRFWRHLPRAGRVTIFDRSWYGRVLVERVEGFAKSHEWQRAFGEINEFESQLTAHGMVVCKFWIQISKEEQLRRFEERQKVAYKKWKITDEDWRNRKKWDDYAIAVDDMVALTDTKSAPWILVEGNSKLHARLKVLRTVCSQLEQRLKAMDALPRTL